MGKLRFRIAAKLPTYFSPSQREFESQRETPLTVGSRQNGLHLDLPPHEHRIMKAKTVAGVIVLSDHFG